jgi:hypothetical protein
MSTPAQIGKTEYRAVITDARNAGQQLRTALKQIYSEGNGLIRTLVGPAAIALGDLEAAVNRLDEIGRNTKPASS